PSPSLPMVRSAIALLRGCLVGVALCATPLGAIAAGTVGSGAAASCTEAALDAALVGGGDVIFRCGPNPVTVILSTVKVIAAPTTVNGGGLITLDGNNAVQIFRVPALQSLTLRDVTLAHGASNVFATPAFGGAINVVSGTLVADHVTFAHNRSFGPGGA